tara:strand:+ start:555 stop:1568 length:1014 start_codon:yes stop_codon:yes gene_type:complete
MSDLVKAAEQALMMNDLESLSPEARLAYVQKLCESMGLNSLTQPFQYIRLNGRLTLYATKKCTDQLTKINNIDCTVESFTIEDGCFIAHARAVVRTTGRVTDDIGVVPMAHLKKGSDAYANARMKAWTKAKRRAVLSTCGLGLLDESELDTIPAQAIQHVTVPQRAQELLGEPQAIEPSEGVKAAAKEAMAPYRKDNPDVIEYEDNGQPMKSFDINAPWPPQTKTAVVSREQLAKSSSTQEVMDDVKQQLKKGKRGRKTNAERVASAVTAFAKLGVEKGQIQLFLGLDDLGKAKTPDINKLLAAYKEITEEGADPGVIFPVEAVLPAPPTGDIKEMF